MFLTVLTYQKQKIISIIYNDTIKLNDSESNFLINLPKFKKKNI